MTVNTGSDSRTWTYTIAGQNFTVTQAGKVPDKVPDIRIEPTDIQF